VALVTGASSGIGKPIASEPGSLGTTVAVVWTSRRQLFARRPSPSEHLAAVAFPSPVMRRPGSRLGAGGVRRNECGPLDVAANNASIQGLLAQLAAADYAGSGTRVNSVHPGFVAPPVLAQLPAE